MHICLGIIVPPISPRVTRIVSVDSYGVVRQPDLLGGSEPRKHANRPMGDKRPGHVPRAYLALTVNNNNNNSCYNVLEQ